MRELHDKEVACEIGMSQRLHPRRGDCATMRVGWEVTVGVTIHDGISDLRPIGVGDEHLRH